MEGGTEHGRRDSDGLGLGMSLGLGLAVTLVGVIVLALAPAAGSLDDVFVVLTEARRLLSGSTAGLPGAGFPGSGLPGPTVESWTSPVDLLMKVVLLGGWPGADPLRAAGWLALMELLVLVGASVAVLRALSDDRARWAVAAFGLVLAPGLLESAAYRLEGPLFALVWMLAVAAAMKGEARHTLVWAVLLGWIRPEGMALGLAACWLARGTGARSAEDRGAAAPRPEDLGTAQAVRGPGGGGRGLFSLSAILIVVPVTAFRRVTYGAWLPNTYHAKRSDSFLHEWMDGAEYATQLAMGSGGLALVLLVGLAAARMRVARGDGGGAAHHGQRVALILAGLALAILVGSGGDSYEGARLALPIGIPLWLGFAACRSSGEGALAGRVLTGLGAVAVLLQAMALVGGTVSEGSVRERLAGARSGPAGMEVFASEREAFGAASRALAGESFAHRHLQRLRWFCPETSVLDLTGLTDRDIAALPAPGQVKFGRDAVGEGVRRKVGALHLDPVGVRSASLVGTPLIPALATPAIAAHFGGPPFLDQALAQQVDAAYLGASFPVRGGFVNLLVRRDLGARFAAEGFLVTGVGTVGR